MKRKISNNLIGMTGEYYVCAELCKQGVIALMTPKNNPLFDIVVSNISGSKAVSIQVKTRSVENTQGRKVSKNMAAPKKNNSLFVVLVNLIENEASDFYIYEYNILADRISKNYQQYLNTPKRDGTQKKDIGFRWYDMKMFTQDDYDRKNKWDLIIKTLS